MSLPLNQLGKEELNFTSERNTFKVGTRCGDLLEEELLRCSKASEQVVLTSSFLVALVFYEENWSEVYRWIHI